MWQCCLNNPEGCINVSLHRPVKLLCADIQNGFVGLLTTSITYQYVQPSKTIHGIFYHLLTKSFVANVTWQSNRFLPCSFYQSNHFLRIRLFGWIITDGYI